MVSAKEQLLKEIANANRYLSYREILVLMDLSESRITAYLQYYKKHNYILRMKIREYGCIQHYNYKISEAGLTWLSRLSREKITIII